MKIAPHSMAVMSGPEATQADDRDTAGLDVLYASCLMHVCLLLQTTHEICCQATCMPCDTFTTTTTTSTTKLSQLHCSLTVEMMRAAAQVHQQQALAQCGVSWLQALPLPTRQACQEMPLNRLQLLLRPVKPLLCPTQVAFSFSHLLTHPAV